MSGEDWLWYKLASHLHCPLQRLQQETTSTEFVKWIEYLQQDLDITRREDYYLAQIAAEVRRGNVKRPEKIKLKDFILKFGGRKRKKRKMSLKERARVSKSWWRALLGLR